MSHYKPYPAYKDSGVEWIGRLPEHWDISKIARLGPLAKANGGSKQDNVDSGVPCIRYGDLYTTHEYFIRGSRSYIGLDKLGEYTPIRYGDALFAASGETFEDIGRSAVNLLREEACCGGDVIVFRLTTNLDPLFLGYALDSMSSKAQKALMGKGYTVVHIYADQLRELIVALPPATEQEAIGTALNCETARIDALIAKKTRFIELLKEKRSALITHAVTKGLDPNVKMKDSGVEWIGEVPEHWGVPPVKICYEARLGKMLQPNAVTQADILVPYHRAQTVQWERIDDLAVDRMWASRADIERFSVDIGDLLICEGGDVCRAAIVRALVGQNLIFQNSLHRVRPKGRHGVEWVLRLMQHLRSSGWIDVLCNKNTIVHFTSEKLGALACPLPPASEQSAIVAFLDRETARIDALVGKTQRSIDLLKERRSAFITAAVTGQIDLRGEIA